jgi:hypothetical protein
MIQSFTVSQEKSKESLRRLADLPGVRHVAVLDAMGLCLTHTGHEPVSTMMLTDWTVIARAAFAACDDLGQRCGAGPCQEALQTYRDGGTLMRALAGGMLMIVQFENRAPVGTVRLVAAEVAMDLPVAVEYRQPVNRAPQRSTSDPFASNNWSTPTQAPSATPVRKPESMVIDA